MDKEKYLRQLYLVDNEITKPVKEFIKKWPKNPSFDSPKHEEWYKDFLEIKFRFPEIEFGLPYDSALPRQFMGRKSIWLDPSIRYKKGLNEYEGEEREELLVKLRRVEGTLLFESARIAIPIYPDTTKEDIETIWPRIEKFKKIAYDHIPKPKKNKWEENVIIYRFGQTQETFKELTGKSGAPWSNVADQLDISPQACRERYLSIKKFINTHTDEKNRAEEEKEKAKLTIQNLDCNDCEKNKECKLHTTGNGDCFYFNKVFGKGEISPQSYISIDQVEGKEARDYDPRKAEDEFLDSLDVD